MGLATMGFEAIAGTCLKMISLGILNNARRKRVRASTQKKTARLHAQTLREWSERTTSIRKGALRHQQLNAGKSDGPVMLSPGGRREGRGPAPEGGCVWVSGVCVCLGSGGERRGGGEREGQTVESRMPIQMRAKHVMNSFCQSPRESDFPNDSTSPEGQSDHRECFNLHATLCPKRNVCHSELETRRNPASKCWCGGVGVWEGWCVWGWGVERGRGGGDCVCGWYVCVERE